VCIVLENFRSLVWQNFDSDAVAYILGDFASFYTDGEGFRINRQGYVLTAPTNVAPARWVWSEVHGSLDTCRFRLVPYAPARRSPALVAHWAASLQC
jgi:hypothetical protein